MVLYDHSRTDACRILALREWLFGKYKVIRLDIYENFCNTGPRTEQMFGHMVSAGKCYLRCF